MSEYLGMKTMHVADSLHRKMVIRFKQTRRLDDIFGYYRERSDVDGMSRVISLKEELFKKSGITALTMFVGEEI